MSMIEMQAKRQERAVTERMSFRLGTLLGQPVVYVQSKTSLWTVPGSPQVPGRCNCPDSQKRCKGTMVRCKHELASWAWFEATYPDPWDAVNDPPESVREQTRREQDVHPAVMEAERRARVARNMGNDFPD